MLWSRPPAVVNTVPVIKIALKIERTSGMRENMENGLLLVNSQLRYNDDKYESRRKNCFPIYVLILQASREEPEKLYHQILCPIYTEKLSH